MKDVLRIFRSLGIYELSREELATIGRRYKHALLDGLNGKSELAMYPSYLDPVDPAHLKQGKHALIIEIGGTHVYGGIVRSEGGTVKLQRSYQASFQTRRYESAAQFFQIVGQLLQPILEHAQPEALGIVYSHPAHNIPSKVGNDAVIDSLSKEFVIPGITEVPLGQLVRMYVGNSYSYLKSLPTVTMNDTTAVLLSCGAPVGGVVATGFNLAVATPRGVANTESGDFEGLVASHAAQEVNEASERPGHHLTEKRVAGLYLPQYFKIGLHALQHEGMPYAIPTDITSATLSAMLMNNPTNETERVYQTLAHVLFTQSAQIVGTLVGTALHTFHPHKQVQVKIPMDGSLFWGAPGYADQARRSAEEASSREISFINIPDAGRIGAGVAALSMV